MVSGVELRAPLLQKVEVLIPTGGHGELPALTQVDTVYVRPQTSGIDLPALLSVRHLDADIGTSNDPFLGFVGLTALQSTETMTITGVTFALDDLPDIAVNELLTIGALNIEGSLAPSLVAGSLLIQDSYRIELGYLEGITDIPGDLSFVDTRTSTLTAWPSLKSVGGDVSLSGNPYLNEQQIEKWLADVEVNGSVLISE